MDLVCEKNRCTGCMACVAACSRGAVRITDSKEAFNARINSNLCINCGACKKVCQVNNKPDLTEPKKWLQGWSADDSKRKQCASGGAAFEIEKAFIRENKDNHVWSCRFSEGGFYIEEIQGEQKLPEFIGSKYVKSNPVKAYKKIREQLKTDKVLFVGLPCQVAGLKNYIGKNNAERLYTIDLICHGTPSPELLESFLNQYDRSLKAVSEISFRKKTDSGIRFEVQADSKSLATKGTCDCYTMSFLEGLTYTRNCYSCAYAERRRVSDLTLGDSWGSELDNSEIKKGISLFVVQNSKGDELIQQAQLSTCSVDAEKAVANNRQLSKPMTLHKNRSRFFNLLERRSFNYAVSRCLPDFWIKQKIKAALIKTKVVK